MLQGAMTDAYDDDNPAPPTGVTLRDPDDSDSVRGDIEGGISTAMQRYVHGFEYGGVRLELSDVKYADKERYSLAEQKEALMSDRLLSRRLRGTVKLIDVETNKPLDVKKNFTLARVPYLTQRGTFINNGSELACFHGTTKVWTESGLMEIRKIVNGRLPIKVWSWSFSSQSLVLRQVTNWSKRKAPGRLGRMQIHAPNGLHPELMGGMTNFSTLWCTPDHKIYTTDGSKYPASQISKVCMIKTEMSSSQVQMVIGTLLGDGFIQSPGVYRVTQCAAQSGYVEMKRQMMLPFIKPGAKVKERTTGGLLPLGKSHTERRWHDGKVCSFDTCGFSAMGEWRDLAYPNGRKTLDSGWYKLGGVPALAFWFCDDGSSGKPDSGSSCPKVTLHTDGFLRCETAALREWLKEAFDLDTREEPRVTHGEDGIGYAITMTGPSAWRLLEMVAPYVPDCLAYKLTKVPKSLQCSRGCGSSVAPNRKICTPCYYEEIRTTKGSLSKSIRVRFGDSATARAHASSNTPHDDDYIRSRWDRIQALQGTGIADLIKDTIPTHGLYEVEANYSEVSDHQYSKSDTVYDIEVEGDHNYFANGVLVSNCTMQSRLLPGTYTRRRDNGMLENHLNVRPGSGSAMRVTLDPQTAQYRIKIGTSDLHAYSLFKELGVSDEELERRWGKQVMEINRGKYSKDTLGRAYMKAIPKWERDPALDPAAKAAAVRAAFDRAQVAESILRSNLPNLFNREKSAFWRSAGRAIDAADGMIKSSTISFSPDLSPSKVFDTWQEFDFELNDAIKEASFDPDLKPGDMKETYNSIYGKKGPRLASMRAWPEHWLDDQDKQGWLQWYENYVDGRRSDQDAKQIERWKGFKRRHGAQFVTNPTPRRAYALTNWAIDPLELLPEEKREEFKGTMEAYRGKEYMKWYMNRHDFDDAAAERLGKLALGRGAELKSDKPGPGELMALALAGHIKPEDLS